MAQGRVADVLDQRLGLDAADLADRDAAALGHVRLGVSDATENERNSGAPLQT
jgi:hypothetical protein